MPSKRLKMEELKQTYDEYHSNWQRNEESIAQAFVQTLFC